MSASRTNRLSDPNPSSSSTGTSSSSISRSPPASLTQLKYALFSWPNNPLTKRDPIAQEYFRTKCQMPNFVGTLGGFPITMYEGSLGPGKPTELFLSGDQCQILMEGLIEKMGPSRARNTWKRDAVHPFSTFAATGEGKGGSGLKKLSFQDQKSVEDKFANLKDSNDRYETRHHFTALLRTQEVARLVQKELNGEVKFCAIDIETWESNHDLVTEVGFAKSVWRDGSFEPMEVRHFVVKENAQHRNGRYCPDARDHFHFGKSETIPTEALVKLLDEELLAPPGPIFLLFHDYRSDIKSLEILGLSVSTFTIASPLPPPSKEPRYLDPKGKGRWILDTQHLFAGYNRRKKQIRLGDAVQQIGITLSDSSGVLEGVGGYTNGRNDDNGKTKEIEQDELKFHNSGNDAWATLLVFWKLMAADLDSR